MIIDAPIVLISDLHLTADAPAGLAEFRQFSERLERVEQLFILGDLFESVSYTHLTLPTILLV